MARNNDSILEHLAILPWRLNLILAAIVYVSFKYLIPFITFQHPFYKGLVAILPSLAPYVAFVLCLTAAASALDAWRKGALLDSQKGIRTIRAISWQEFEQLVGEAYRRKGYAVTESGGGGADGGIDLVLRRGDKKLLVQCKHWWIDKVGVKVVRELYGVVAAEGVSGGIVISSGTFTREAKDFASGKPLELIDGPELLKMISEVQKIPMPVSHALNDALCPLCGQEMVLRTARKGTHAGERFWGCSAYPKCRGTKPYKS
jgi:restriction system protein